MKCECVFHFVVTLPGSRPPFKEIPSLRSRTRVSGLRVTFQQTFISLSISIRLPFLVVYIRLEFPYFPITLGSVQCHSLSSYCCLSDFSIWGRRRSSHLMWSTPTVVLPLSPLLPLWSLIPGSDIGYCFSCACVNVTFVFAFFILQICLPPTRICVSSKAVQSLPFGIFSNKCNNKT